MDLHDDLDDWGWDGDELQDQTLRRTWTILRTVAVAVRSPLKATTVRIQVRIALPPDQ